MKKLLVIPILLMSLLMKAQCPQTTCIDSLPYNITVDSLKATFPGYTPTSIQWKIIFGPGSLGPQSANTIVQGLKPGTHTVIQLKTAYQNFETVNTKVIVVAPVPVPHPIVTGFQLSNGKVLFTFSDKFVQTL